MIVVAGVTFFCVTKKNSNITETIPRPSDISFKSGSVVQIGRSPAIVSNILNSHFGKKIPTSLIKSGWLKLKILVENRNGQKRSEIETFFKN